MRIISKQRDYYDGIMSTGVDTSLIYVRDERVIKPKDERRSYNDWTPMIIGFCGKLYPFWNYTKQQYPYDEIFMYNMDEVDEFMDKTLNEKYHQKSSWKYSPRNRFKNHFDGDNNGRALDFFEEYRVPVFILNTWNRKLTLNGLLAPWEFYRVFDAWSAYQELSMYLGSVLLPESRPIPKIDDETLASAKGFDKWSFRKESTK